MKYYTGLLTVFSLFFFGIVTATPVPPAPGFGRPPLYQQSPQDAGNCKMPERGLDLLKQFEGFVPAFYNDVQGVQTVGYGHACPSHPGSCESLSTPLSEQQATTLLQGDLGQYEDCVKALPSSGGLGLYQFAALVDFAYNAGCGTLATEFTAVMQNGNIGNICAQLETADTKGGLIDIVNRRKKEAALCKTPTSKTSGC